MRLFNLDKACYVDSNTFNSVDSKAERAERIDGEARRSEKKERKRKDVLEEMRRVRSREEGREYRAKVLVAFIIHHLSSSSNIKRT